MWAFRMRNYRLFAALAVLLISACRPGGPISNPELALPSNGGPQLSIFVEALDGLVTDTGKELRLSALGSVVSEPIHWRVTEEDADKVSLRVAEGAVNGTDV